MDDEQLLFIAGGQDNAIDEDVDEQPVQDLALNVDNVFQADDSDAFDSDVDEDPTAQTMFMANLSSADPTYDEANPSYDSDILSEVPDYDNYQDAVCEHHEVHEMHDDVQPNYVVDSHADYTSDSNMIPYDRYVKDNAVPVVQSNVSSVPNDAYMMILNDIYESYAQYVFVTTHNNVVEKSLTAELATYKEQVKLYERQAKFELTEREQKIDEQLRIVITNRNIKEENLKNELHYLKLQLTSTINHNKSMVEEVTSLKKDFKQRHRAIYQLFQESWKTPSTSAPLKLLALTIVSMSPASSPYTLLNLTMLLIVVVHFRQAFFSYLFIPQGEHSHIATSSTKNVKTIPYVSNDQMSEKLMELHFVELNNIKLEPAGSYDEARMGGSLQPAFTP
ncbi:hypothetical protein Tco_0628315 [Tanacetum coccineum]|uniref:Uncharacterized protein n=1 Tax=Tanacetum coccineum TaxID=301880 RepID=A0ABQ4WQ34_9ASTR